MKNVITLIGMPASGKSQVGKQLETHGWKVIDTDHRLISKLGNLTNYIAQHGNEKFHHEEEKVITTLNPLEPTIISTGGSVVYLERAMAHLRSLGPVVWLKASEQTLKEHKLDLVSRGVVNANKGIGGLLAERNPLYELYSSHTICVDNETLDQTVQRFLTLFPKPQSLNAPGYHLTDIPRGTFGDSSKILEETLELKDAELQGSKVMALIELSDLYGAIQGYLEKHHPTITMEDLAKMSAITQRAFKNGHRS